MTPTAHRYGAGPDQFGELTVRGGAAAPVVVLLHGGFWRARYTLDLMRPLAADLVGRGYATWNLEYRRADSPGADWPATLADVAAGVDALAALADDHPLDLERVVLVGHSAGGQLALWAAAQQLRVRPAVVVSLAGVLDLRAAARERLGRDAVVAFLGGTPDEVPQRYEEASPRTLLPLGVPQLLVHGTADDRVPVDQSRSYAATAADAGDKCRLLELDGVDHMALIDPASDAWRRTGDALVGRAD